MKSYFQALRLIRMDARLYLAASTLTTISYTGIYVLIFNLYLLRLGYGPEFIGLVNGAAQLGVVAFSLPAGILGRLWGSRRVLMAGLVVATLGLILVPVAEFVPDSWQASWLVLTYILAWLGGATYLVNGLSFVMAVTDGPERAHVFSLREALGPLALFAGNLFGGLLPGFLSMHSALSLEGPAAYRYTLFIATALFGVTPLLFLKTSAREGYVTPEPAASPDRASRSAPVGLIGLMVVIALLQLASRSVSDTFFNVYLDVTFQLSPGWIGALAATAQLLVVPVALSAPMIVSKLGKGRTIALGTLGMALSLLLYIAYPHWGLAGAGLVGVSSLFAITTVAFTIYSQELVATEWRTTMAGAMAMATGMSRSTMSFAGGYLVSAFGFSSLFMVGAGLTVLGAVIFACHFWIPRLGIRQRVRVRTTSL
jgi:MFS family permease